MNNNEILRGFLTLDEDTEVRRQLADILHAGKKDTSIICSFERAFIKRMMFLIRIFTICEANQIGSIHGRLRRNRRKLKNDN